MTIVLDASALLAYLNNETGADNVDAVISKSLISTVNWSEVVQKSLSRGVKTEGLREDLESLGVSIEAFTLEDAECAAKLWPITRILGLSLGDRACLAFAMRRQVPVFTADRAWVEIA
ncbi:MAG: type II toxin-antitoxin system VapC family toxin [Methylomonas sp.]|jgi:PIN domain nuclease of toxin-antitoxin system